MSAEGRKTGPDFNSKNFYERLGVPAYAADGEIKEAIQKLRGQYHPDKQSDPRAKTANTEIMKLINEANRVIGRPKNREGYDRSQPFDSNREIMRRQREEAFKRRQEEKEKRSAAAKAAREAEAAERARVAAEKAAKDEAAEAATAQAQNGTAQPNEPQSNASDGTGEPPPAGGSNANESQANAGTADDAGRVAREQTERETAAAEAAAEAERAAREQAEQETAAAAAAAQGSGTGEEPPEPPPNDTEAGEPAPGQSENTTDQEASDGRKEPKMNGESNDKPLEQPDGTQDWRDRWRNKLREVVSSATEKFDWYKSSEEKLIRRNKELDDQLEKLGGVERGFRWIGENYNKLGWKSKLGIGVALGLGTGVAAAVSLPAALTGVGLMTLQRAAGLATMYLKFEKNAVEKNKKWGKEIAMLKAVGYTVAMGTAMNYAVKGVEALTESDFIKSLYSSKHPDATSAVLGGATEAAPSPGANAPLVEQAVAPEAASATGTSDIPLPKDILNSQHAANIKGWNDFFPDKPFPGDTVASEEIIKAQMAQSAEAAASPTPTMPNIEVAASAGHGYEFMAKRVWEGLQSQNLDASKFSPDSDIYKLVNADAANIDKIVHQLATQHQAYAESSGASLKVDLGSHLSFNSDGQLELATPSGSFVNAPEGAAVTPPYSAESVPIRPPPPEVREMFGQGDAQGSPVEAEEVIPAVTPEPPATTEPLQRGTVEQPQIFERVEAQPGDATILGQPETPASDVQPEATPVTEVLRNQFGLEIPAGQSHIYAGEGNRLFVFGGTPENQAKAIGDFFTSPDNAKSVIYGTDVKGEYRIPYFLGPDGKPTIGLPERTSGFLGFGSSWMKPPSLDDLRKLIK